MSGEKKVEQDERGAFAAIHEFLGIASKRLYPTPDKPNSDWAKLRAAVDALALIHEARAAATSANVDRFDPYRLKVAEECCERLMSACTDAGCPDGVRMDDWIRENVRSTSANVAQGAEEPDCWAILTPNGSRLVSPDEAKGRLDAYPLYTAPTAQTALRRIAHELRTYNPAADEYKGEHIHKVWAREIEALLPAASNGEPK